MKIKDIFLKLLNEQNNDVDLETLDDDNELRTQPQRQENGDEDLQQLNQYQSPYSTRSYVAIKNSWRQETQNFSEQDFDSAIELFNRKKNNLIPYREDYTAEGVQFRGTQNQPEVISFGHMFPNFDIKNIQKLRDLNSYTWEQINYFTQRFITEDSSGNYDLKNIDGNFEILLDFWKSPQPTTLVNTPNIVIHKIRNKTDTEILGKLQHSLVRKYGDNNWCITNPGNTFYNSYRSTTSPRRSYYFVLLPNRDESDKYFTCVVQPCSNNTYVITGRKNTYGGELTGLHKDDVLSQIPEIEPYLNKLTFNELTYEEKNENLLDLITFTNKNSPNYFMRLPPYLQNRYIESNRNINYINPYRGLTRQQLSQYIRGTNKNNYINRFNSFDVPPFGIIDALRKERPEVYREIDNFFKGVLQYKSGIRHLINKLLFKDFKPLYYNDKNNNLKLIYNDNLKAAGLFDSDSGEFLSKPIYFIKGYKYYTKVRHNKDLNVDRDNVFMVIKFQINDEHIDNQDIDMDNYPSEYDNETFYIIVNNKETPDGRNGTKGVFLLSQNEILLGDKMWAAIK